MAGYPKLTLSSIGTTSVKFKIATSSWEGDTFYVYYRPASGNTGEAWKTVSGYSYGETFSITGLSSGTRYAFRVSEFRDFTGEYGSGTLSEKTTSSSAFDCGYFTTDEEVVVEGYEYAFYNNSNYTLFLSFSLSTSGVSSLSIPAGGTRYIVCEPADMVFNVSRCEVDGETGYADCIYWQRTSPTTGTKYCLDSSSGNVLSLRSSSDATYTFTVSGYAPAPTTYTVTFRHYLGSSFYESTSTVFEEGSLVTLSSYAKSYAGYAYSYATNSSGTTITRLTVTGNTTVYLYYTASTFTVTFRHYLNGSLEETTSTSVTSGSSITISNYAESYSGYEYDHAENSSGSTITRLTVSGNTTVYLYYVSISVTITFRHYRGNALYTTKTATVNYGTTVTVSSYKITTMPNCVYNSASVSSFTATADRTVNLYYTFAWTYAKTKGGDWNLTATEWNNLIDFVNDQRSSDYSFTSAVKGNTFTATMYNQMVSAIGAGTTVSKGQVITAALMNALVTNANNM